MSNLVLDLSYLAPAVESEGLIRPARRLQKAQSFQKKRLIIFIGFAQR